MSGAGPAVTIAGGGLSGLTAALTLARRGYKITLYEQKSLLGGNLGSRRQPDGQYLDVYPHMYLTWYRNFWALLESVTHERREESFEPYSTVKQLAKGAYPRFATITDMYSPWHLIPNLFSGVGPPADMFVFGYASIDLLAAGYNPFIDLDNVDVNAFLNTRPYMTRAASEAFDSFITRVWAVPSYLASAPDFRRYLRYCLRNPTPAFWLPTGSGYTTVIEPMVSALQALGVNLVPRTQITSVTCEHGRVTEIGLERTRFDKATQTWLGVRGSARTEGVDNLLLAVPAPVLSQLVRTPVAPVGPEQGSVVQAAPDIAGIVRLRATRVPLIYLYFKRKLRGIPKEPVGFSASRLSLAFTDISQNWANVPAFAGRTVLAVSSSDTGGLPGTNPDADAHAMLLELAEYLPFDPGTRWGDSPDIDWTHTVYDTNADSQLFINQTGTDAWRPDPTSSHISNIYLAGDFCNNDVGMTTIESAVTTGLAAARAIVHRNRHGTLVTIIAPDTSILADASYVWLSYAWLPYAFAASFLSRLLALVAGEGDRSGQQGLPWLRWLAGAGARTPGLRWIKRPRREAGGRRWAS